VEDETIESQGTGMFCRGCYAEVGASSGLAVCPACGDALVVHTDVDSADLPVRPADRRGILLPRRHAVGGVITPR